MTLANSVFTKASVAFVALATAFVLAAPAQALTEDEMQTEIDRLTALIEQLTASLGGGTTGGSSSSCASIPAPLTIGAQNANVTALQNFLIGAGQSIPAGATGYFGSQTQAALAGWQAANGVAPAVGYYGPITASAMAAKCVPSTSDDDDMMDDDDDSGSMSLSGEGSLGDTNLSQGDDTDIEEGQEDAPVAELELNFENGDVMISRIDLSFVAQGTEDQAWDTFENVSLWVDGDKVAEKDADSKGDYLGDEDNGVLRFSGLDIFAEEDQDVTIVIGVTPQVGIDLLAATWDVDALNVRYTDADDVTTTDTITETATSFTIDDEGGDDEINVKSSSDDPDATTIQVETDTRSGWETIFVFDLDSDDSTNDITVDGITVSLTTDDAGGVDDVVSDVRLVADGQNFDDWSPTTANALSDQYVFDLDNNLEIEAGDRIPVEVQVRFAQLTGNYAEGTTIQATTTSADIDADGVDTVTNLSGVASGEVHTLRSEGAIIEFVSSSETLKANTDTTTADDEGVYVIKFDVTAFETDLFVLKSAAASTTLGTVGVNYLVEDGAGSTVTVNGGVGTTTSSLTSTADTDNNRFQVNEGETETFTLTVNFDPDTQGFYQLQLGSLNFGIVNTGNPTVLQSADPAEDFETDSLSI